MDALKHVGAWTLPRSQSLAISLSTLAAAGFSMALLVYQLPMAAPTRRSFLIDNVLGAQSRARLLVLLLLGGALPAIAALAVWVWKGPEAERGITRWARILSPLVLAFSVPVLFVWQTAQANPLMYLVMLSLFGLAARPLLTSALGEVRSYSGPETKSVLAVLDRVLSIAIPRWVYWVTIMGASLGYAAYTGYFTILNHRLLHTTAFDLGIYDNLMYNAMSGSPFRSPVLFGPGDRSYLAGHAEYAMLLFVPFYAIRPNAETLLLIQSALLGFAAVPLYLFAQHLLSRGAALVVALSYLLFAPLHGPNFYDFHWLPLAIFFHFWLYWAIATHRTWLVALMVVVLFAIREDVAIGLALLGTFLFVTGARTRLGIVLAATSSLWFVVNKFVIMPSAGSWWFENIYAELFADGKASYASVVTTLISNPVYAVSSFIRSAKLEYGLHMIAPLAFLPLRRVAFVLLLIPGAAFTLMTTGYWPTVQISFQYTTHWIPYLFLATVLALWTMRFTSNGHSQRSAALAVLCITMVSHSFAFGAILQRESVRGGFLKVAFAMGEQEKRRYGQMMSLVEKIPREASVAATEYLNPHISARKEAYAFRYDFGPVDYILVTQREMTNENRKVLGDVVKKHSYGLLASAGEFYLFKRNLEGDGTSEALRRLGIRV